MAGLGVGGLAVALAAQKTIENLFGGISVIGDRPVLVGDVCRFGNETGTVMHIGLRSTRIRTADRTIISIPNSQFSSMALAAGELPPDTHGQANDQERQAPRGQAAATPVAEDRDGRPDPPARPGNPRPFGGRRASQDYLSLAQ